MVNINWKTIKPGGLLDRHPLSIPATFLSIAWLPYAIVFARSSISFGDLGAPVLFPEPLYWLLLALQLFVCVISHSLAIRTIIGLYAPFWLIVGSLAFFCLSPIWGMLTAADVRYPLFAMMVCVLTSSIAFIVYSPRPKTWLWIELALACILVCLLRSTGFWSVLPSLAALLVFQIAKDARGDEGDVHEGGREIAVVASDSGARRAKLGANTASMASVLVVVGGSLVVCIALGLGEPLGEPPYTGMLVAHDVALSQIESISLMPGIAISAADALVKFQDLPVINITFMQPFYVGFFLVFLVAVIARRDWKAFIVGLPQVAIFALSMIDPAHSTLAFVIPAMAAQIMFFGAAMRGTDIIGTPSPMVGSNR